MKACVVNPQPNSTQTTRGSAHRTNALDAPQHPMSSLSKIRTYGREDIELANRLLTAEARRADRVTASDAIANLAILQLFKNIEGINAARHTEIAAVEKAWKKAKRDARKMYKETTAAGHAAKRAKREGAFQISAPMPEEGKDEAADCPLQD